MELILLSNGEKKMNSSIYIVEDEAIIALEIKQTILKLGYRFAGMASNYDDAILGIQKTKPDLILMDIMLKDSKSGIEIANALNDIQSIPIIFLTSVKDSDTMQDAILTTPSAYLLKPFRREELQSAILLSLHKSSLDSTDESRAIDIGYGYSYHSSQNLLYYHDNPIRLSTKERIFLECLIEARGTIKRFADIEDRVWHGEYVSSGALRALLHRLRKKLNHELIETISTIGYRIVLPEA